MQMVRHIINGNQFLFLTGDDPSDELLKFVIVLRLNEILSALDRKHDVDVDLRVSISHSRKMPLLTELEIFFPSRFYKDVAPAVLVNVAGLWLTVSRKLKDFTCFVCSILRF